MRFAETDAQGVAHNSDYLVWFEVARVAYLEALTRRIPVAPGPGHRSVRRSSPRPLPLPAHFDDRLEIHARVGELRGASFRFDYSVSGARSSRGGLDLARVRRRVDPASDPDPPALADAVARAEAPS